MFDINLPSDIQFKLSYDKIRDRSSAQPSYNLTRTEPGNFCTIVRGLPDFLRPANQANNGCIENSYAVATNSGFDLFTRGIAFEGVLDADQVIVKMNSALNEDLEWTYLFGYRDQFERFRFDPLGSPLVEIAGNAAPILFISSENETTQMSHELRLSGDFSENISGVVGLYYFDTQVGSGGGRRPDEELTTVIRETETVEVAANQFVFGDAVNAFEYQQDLQAVAVFGDATILIAPDWSISTGLRYTQEEKKFSATFIPLNSPGSPFAPLPNVARDQETFNALTGRFALQYQIAENSMLYASLQNGFRSGGYNGRAGSAEEIGPYDEEYVDSLEFGLRFETANRRIQINPTLFLSRYEDKQEEVVMPIVEGGGATRTLVQNAASVTIQGLEVDTRLELTPQLSLQGSLGLLDAEYDEFLIPNPDIFGAQIDVSNERSIRRAPDWTYFLALDYETEISNSLKLSMRGAYAQQGDFAAALTADVDGFDIIENDSSVDFSVSLENKNKNDLSWKATFFINDALDDAPGKLASFTNAGPFATGVGVPTKLYGVSLILEL